MTWDEFDAIITAANLESTLSCSDWRELEIQFYKWKEKKEQEDEGYIDSNSNMWWGG